MFKHIIYSILVVSALVSCSPSKVKYHIGVSQCSEDIWRDWQNAEMRMEANFHENVSLSFTTAHDNSQLQSQQIDSLVASGIDLLIVAPNQLTSVSPAIDRAYDSGVPVIVFERKTDSRKYTAFVSADNYEMGRQMGDYIAVRMGGKGQIMEILGLRGSSPADERHRGFREAIARYPNIEVTAMLQGDWTEETAYGVVKDYLSKHANTSFDVVFGHNDRTAIGARRAFEELHQPLLPSFCGIDGLPGENGGICQVRDSLLTASYIYPTRGDLLLQVALDILEGRPYEKEVMLTSALVTRENAKVLLLESDEVMRRSQQLDLLQDKASSYLQRINVQRMVMLLGCVVIVLLLVAIGLFYLYHRNKVNMQRERVLNNLWNLRLSPEKEESTEKTEDSRKTENTEENKVSETYDSHSESSASSDISNSVVADSEPSDSSAPSTDAAQSSVSETAKSSPFITRFREVVERRMHDSELSVEDIAAEMNLSRVQLYRKVKNLSGASPVELLRTARLNRGYQLLLTTDKTVSEVAYAVGFSAPAYFTKCFKDEFGMVPGDVRR